MISQSIKMLVCTFFGLLFFTSSCSAGPKFERIRDGSLARVREFPYQVSVQNQTQHKCGGSILSEEWVLTAAHCVANIDESDISIKGGLIDILTSASNRKSQQRMVTKKIIHNKYFKEFPTSRNPNDLALLKLQSPLEFDEFVNKIDLPDKKYEPNGFGVISGWGRTHTRNDSKRSRFLRKTTVQILPHEKCVEYGEYSLQHRDPTKPKQHLHRNQFCIGTTVQGGHPLSGDSGGPLTQEVDGRRVLAGVISWGPKVVNSKTGGGFIVNVAKYRSWIECVMKGETEKGCFWFLNKSPKRVEIRQG